MTGPFSPAGGNTRPASIFLKKYARTGTGDAMNDDTTATVRSSDGHILEISLWFHQPPALAPPAASTKGRTWSAQRAASSSSGPASSSPTLPNTEYEYFMFKGGFGEPLSLDPIPFSYSLPRNSDLAVAVVPRGHGGHEYLLAALAVGFDSLYYKLHIYSSEDKSWTLVKLQNPIPQLDKVITSKLVNLGEGGLVAWVDYLHGMLVCDLHDETNPTARYIPLPDLLPGNRDEMQRQLQEVRSGPCTGRYRDLACINGVLKFIEMKHHVAITTESPPEKGTIVLDSDLIMSRQRKEPEPPVVESWNGWTAVTWSRTISSAGWEMGIVLDAGDIVFDNPMDLSPLLSRLKGEADVGKLAFKHLYSAFPTLSTDGDDVIYLKSSTTKWSDPDARMVALNLGTKRAKAIGDCALARHWPYIKAFAPCTVPHLTTGKVSSSASSARDQNHTSIYGGHPCSCEPDNKRQRLLAEKVNHGHY
ncbi:unnamed protein product [Urochloa decumbens]|uniref:DUF1618 domain-containing protein n=1 Tax=Urochloa decumbens TaxID=240449 RepID=A0ABC8XQJ5_9POAL